MFHIGSHSHCFFPSPFFRMLAVCSLRWLSVLCWKIRDRKKRCHDQLSSGRSGKEELKHCRVQFLVFPNPDQFVI